MLCVLLLWLSFNSFWQDWQFSVVKVWLKFSLQFFKAKSQLDKRDPSLTWCRHLFYFYTSSTSFYSKRTHENNNLPPVCKENITFLVVFFSPVLLRNSISVQEDPDPLLASRSSITSSGDEWGLQVRAAPTSGSPSVTSRICTAFSEHNYTSGSFQSVADMVPFSVPWICNYVFKRLLYAELDVWILWYGCRHLISHILCYAVCVI